MQKPPKLCGTLVPDRLLPRSVGELKCSKEVSKHGWHTGDHKTHYIVGLVGRVTIAWKQGPEYRPAQQPPLVDVRAFQVPVLTGGLTVSSLRCRCPEWWLKTGSKHHRAPCGLA